MNLYKQIFTGFFVTCSLLAIALPSRATVSSLNSFDRQLLAQANELEGLKKKDISDWRFNSNQRTTLPREEKEERSQQQLEGIQIDSNVNLRLERNDKTWESNGDDEDDAVMLDLYRQ
jgi:hypothetical protein